jgi:hypothetical protein
MMARSTRSKQRPDTLMQDRYLAGIDESLLQRAAGPYIGVTPGRTQVEHIESASPPRSGHLADMPGQPVGATNGLMHCGKVNLRAALRVVPKGAMRLDRDTSTPGISAASG